jgi:hypothetical protein
MESAEPLAALFFCQLDRRLKGDRRERGCGGQQPWNDAMKEGILIPDRSKHARIQHLPFSQHATQQFAKEEMIVCTGSWNPPSYHYTFRSILSKKEKRGSSPGVHKAANYILHPREITSPVQNARKFSAVRGTRWEKSSMEMRPSCSIVPDLFCHYGTHAWSAPTSTCSCGAVCPSWQKHEEALQRSLRVSLRQTWTRSCWVYVGGGGKTVKTDRVHGLPRPKRQQGWIGFAFVVAMAAAIDGHSARAAKTRPPPWSSRLAACSDSATARAMFKTRQVLSGTRTRSKTLV